MKASLAAWTLLQLAFSPHRAEEWDPSTTHALIVGVLEWRNDLTPFPKRHRKDRELRDLLVRRGTPAGNVTLLLDDEATLPRIRAAVADTLRRAPEGSTLIVYYAGHGWADGDDICFANYEVEPERKESAWSLKELGTTLAEGFKGRRAFLWADCCYSGGLQGVVDALASREVAGFSLTSTSAANLSTDNWTFTQSLIDGLAGEPLADLDGDGRITLGELRAEVRDAMKHLEGQEDGFRARGLDETFVLGKTAGPRPAAPDARFPIGSYVVAAGRYGRVIAAEGESYSIRFFRYSRKVVREFDGKDLAASTRKPGGPARRLDVGLTPDCRVEWQGAWYDAKVLSKEAGRWRIRYVGYRESWDEWVGEDRIRLKVDE